VARRLVLAAVGVTTLLTVCVPASASADSPYAQAVISDAPTVYYRLGEASGPVAADLSGHGYSGTYALTGVGYGEPGAIVGDPDTAIVNTAAGPAVTSNDTVLPMGASPRTLMIWEKSTAIGPCSGLDCAALMQYGARGTAGSGMVSIGVGLALPDPAQLFFVADQGGFGVGFPSNYSLDDGRWHFLAATYDGDVTVHGFIDGLDVGTRTLPKPLDTDAGNGALMIGGTVEVGFPGGVDEAAVFPEALSSAQIAAVYQASGENPRPPLIVGPATLAGPVRGDFFSGNTGVRPFASNAARLAFSESFPVLNFNPDPGFDPAPWCANATGVAGQPGTRPLTDVIPQPDGTCTTLPAVAHLRDPSTGPQAGVRDLYGFYASFTGLLHVGTPGDITFAIRSDDGWALGFGPAQGGTAMPSRVAGQHDGPALMTAERGYPVLGSASETATATVRFPASGYYPFEDDYSESYGSGLEHIVGVSGVGPLQAGPGPSVRPLCGIPGADIVRRTRNVAILVAYPRPSTTTFPYLGGAQRYLACWTPTQRVTPVATRPGPTPGVTTTFDGPVIAGGWVAVPRSVQHPTARTETSAIVLTNARAGRTFTSTVRTVPPTHGGPPNLLVTALTLTRCGTLAYAYRLDPGLRGPAGASHLVVWEPGGPLLDVFTGPLDTGTLRLGSRYVYWHANGRRHRQRISATACR
jgi:Concanavalin A-like lectin/glucanases superfamily